MKLNKIFGGIHMKKKQIAIITLLVILIQILLNVAIPIKALAEDMITIQCADQAFYNKLVEALGDKVSSKNDTAMTITMTKTNVDSITRLDLSNSSNFVSDELKIKNISGIEKFTNLERLELYYNPISDISALSALTKLTYLSADNQISDISALSRLTNLTHLDLGSNQISDISALSGLTNLTYLELANNQISDISALSGLTNLTFLSIFFNQISDISALSGLTRLTNLDLHNNRISDISALSGLTNLTQLSLPRQ